MPLKHFPSIDRNVALGRPILYSNWMTKNYVSVDREELRGYVKARLKVRERERGRPLQVDSGGLSPGFG